MAEIASAFVSIVPSFKGGGAAIAKELGAPAAKAGPEAGKRFGGGLMNGVKGVAGPLAGMLAGLVAADKIAEVFGQALEQGAASAKLGAQLGMTGAEAAKAGKLTGAIYADNYGDSLEQVNEAAADVTRNIGLSFNSVDFKGVTGKVLNLATTFDQDLGGVTTAVGTMLRTHLAPNAQAAIDIITAGMQSGANSADDLLDTFTEYPTLFRNLGLSGQQAMGLINQGLKAGARNSDLVADALKEFSIRAVDGSTTTADGMKALGLSAKQFASAFAKGGPEAAGGLQLVLDRLRAMKDPVKRSQAAVALFGTQAEDLGQALYSLDVDKATASLGKVGGAADRMAKTLASSPKAQLDAFKRRVSQTFVDAAGSAVGGLMKLRGSITSRLGPALKQGQDLAKAFYNGLTGGSAGGSGPLTEVTNLGNKIGTAFKGIGASLATLGGPLKQFGLTLLPILKQIGSQILAVVGPALKQIGQIITTQVVPAFRAFLPAVAPIAAFLLKLFGSAIVGALKGVVNVVKGVLTILAGVFNIFAGIFTGDWSKVWNGIKQVASGIWSAIKGAFQIFINVGLGRVFKLGGALLGKIGKGIWSLLSKLFSTGTRAVGSIVSRGVSAVVRFFGGLPGKALGVLRSLAGRLGKLFTGALNRARTAVTDGIGKLLGKLREIPGKAVSALGNLGRTLYRAGTALIGGLVNGIKDKAESVVRAAKGVVSDAVGAAKNLLGIHSPSRVFAEIGVNIGRGLSTGIESTAPQVATSAAKLAGATLTPMQKAAAEMLKQIRGGGAFFEDFSFRGNSANVRKFSDQIADQFYRSHRGFDFGAPGTNAEVEKFLQGLLRRRASVARPGATGSTIAGAGAMQVRVFIGERELTDIVRVEVRETNRGIRRSVLAGTGGAR